MEMDLLGRQLTQRVKYGLPLLTGHGNWRKKTKQQKVLDGLILMRIKRAMVMKKDSKGG